MDKRVVKCTNGHFFDGNKYEVCPICGEPEVGGNATTTGAASSAVNKEAEVPAHMPTEGEKNKKQEIKNDGEKEKGGFFKFIRTNKNGEEINKPTDKTYGIGTMRPQQESMDESVPQPTPEPVPEPQPEPIPQPVPQLVPHPIPQPVPQPIPQSIPEAASSLASQVKQQAGTLDGKTTGRYTTEGAEPVVGWLVATSSVSQGMAFSLYEGKNSIGRMRTNKVALEYDNSVSKEKHAFVLFDSKNQVFYVQAGESDMMTYLNGAPVLMPQQLKAYDVIQLGECDLVFIPLCGENFKWEDYIK